MAKSTEVDLLSGTLDMLVLKAVSLGPLHGYGVLLRIQQLSGNGAGNSAGLALSGALPPGARGRIASEWGTSENNRRARFYRLTAAGRRRLDAEIKKWSEFAGVIGTILGAAQEPV